MGYDLEFIRLAIPANTGFPVDEKRSAGLLKSIRPFDDVQAVRKLLLGLPGAKPGPEDAIDFLGQGLSYARFVVRPEVIFIENNASARDMLTAFERVRQGHPDLVIHDLQSRQLHDAESFQAWWSRPL